MNKPDWFPITDDLRFGLEHGEGWNGIVKPLVEYCMEHNIQILQVKEKFGGLRFYHGGNDEKLDRLIRIAEEMANNTCEVCGVYKLGVARRQRKNGYWLKTVCNGCWEKW